MTSQVVVVSIPVFLVAVLNIKIIVTLKRNSMKRSVMTSAPDKDDSNITRLLVALVTTFTIFNLPGSVAIFGTVIMGGQQYIDSVPFNIYICITNTLLFANAACNFYLYCAVSRKFREATYALFKCE